VYAVALASLLVLYLRRARAVGLCDGATTAGVLMPVGAAVIGTRVFYLVTTGAVLALPVRAWFSFDGTASWGAYLGAALGLLLWLRHRRLPAVPYFDVAASCAGLGIAIGRWACLLNGDDFGRVTDVAWAIRYPAGSQAWTAHVAVGILPPASPASLPVHPFQIYLSLNAVLAFLVCSSVWRRWRDLPGVTLSVYLLLDGCSRFALEFLRDPAAGGSDGLSVSQVMCACEVAIALTLMLLRLAPWRSGRSARLDEANVPT
jgi:phosphatidylglycerol:prolipoprotein diacylglycerol transferase